MILNNKILVLLIGDKMIVVEEVKVKTVGDLVKKLLMLPQNAEIFGQWEGITPPIEKVIYDEKRFKVYLDVDG